MEDSLEAEERRSPRPPSRFIPDMNAVNVYGGD
jgi:hypothetical protein